MFFWGVPIIKKQKFWLINYQKKLLINSFCKLRVKKALDSINMINSYAISKIEKCIPCTNEEYSYALSLQADCVPDSKIMIKKRLETLNSLLTLAKLI